MEERPDAWWLDSPCSLDRLFVTLPFFHQATHGVTLRFRVHLQALLGLFCLFLTLSAQAYNHAGTYTFAARWDEFAATTSGGITTYPEEHGGLNEYDVCPPKQLSLMFPGAVVPGNIQQTCANVWVALIESSHALGSASTLTRAKDLSEDWDINFIDPSDSSSNYWFKWLANQYVNASIWGNPSVARAFFPITLTGGPHSGESVLGNNQLLALGDDKLLLYDTDGSLSLYNYPGGSLQSNPTGTAFTNGDWHGQTLTSKLKYMVGYEEGKLYFVEGSNKLLVYSDGMVWQRTQTVALGHELSAYSVGDLVDNKIPGYTYVGWDVGPIVIGVTALRPLDHLEVSSSTASSTAGTPIEFTIKACASASCSTPYTRGVSGSLSLSDGSTASFSIPAGSNTTAIHIVVPSVPPGGYVTVSHSGLSVTPIGSPSLYCGFGIAASSSTSCNHGVTAALHHLAITTAASTGLTCMPTTFTVTACANASCSAYFSDGVSGQLTLQGTGATVIPSSSIAFSISAGSSSQTVQAQVTEVPTSGYVTVGASGLSHAPTDTPSLYCGLGTAASSAGSCQLPVHLAGLLLSVPDHLSESDATLSITAVKQGTQTASCVPAFAHVTKLINLACAYSNPHSGTLAARINDVALNASGNAAAACGSGTLVPLSFDSTGSATATLKYADAGQVSLSGSYTGAGTDAGLSMTGSTSFVAIPASLTISQVSPPPLTAGSPFSATLRALNSAGNTTPNFGQESPASSDYVRVSWSTYQPTGTHASAGTFEGTGSSSATPLSSGHFHNGMATVSDLTWSEVGSGDLSASLVGGNFLMTGSGVSGTSGSHGSAGVFRPHHLDVSVTPACGAFTYSGQPFSVGVVARNAAGAMTRNYDGSAHTSPHFATAVTLSATTNGSSGSLTGATIAASQFISGAATIPLTPTFTFTHKLTPPTSVSIRAVDSHGVSSAPGGLEPSLTLRSGRIKMSNAFGSEKRSLHIPVQTQYWSGRLWLINSADSCTTVPASSVAFSHHTDARGQSAIHWSTTASSVAITGGQGTLTLSPPGNAATGSVDFAFNLGSTSTDRSCLLLHPVSTGANLSWLRSQNGSSHACAGIATYDRDPSARATFGIYSPESQRVIHLRDLF